MNITAKLKTYPIDKVMSISFAAHRINSGYVKNTTHIENGPTIWANKEIIAYTISSQERDAGNTPHAYIPTGFKPVEVTEQDIENAQLAKKHVSRSIMGLISGAISTFQKEVYYVVSEENVPVNKIGLVSYVPELLLREISEKERIKRIKEEYKNSVHYTTKVSGFCEILKVFHMKAVDCYVYICGIDGNLVSFTNLKKYDMGAHIHITARVKRSDHCMDTGLPMTRIHYVKIKKNDKISKTN